jgi:hypothetical protein
MKTYRMEQTATICFDVEADTRAEAMKKAQLASADFSSGFKLPSGTDYSGAVMYTSTEELADVIDITVRP